MNAVDTKDVDEILKNARDWSPAKRLALVQDLLRMVELELAPRPKKSLKDLVGILKTDGPPPSDQECDRIVEEERMKKYGG